MNITYCGNHSNVFLSAVFEELGVRIRIRDGVLKSMSTQYPPPIELYGLGSARGSHPPVFSRNPTATVEIEILPEGMVVDKYDPLEPVPISSKTVEECTNDELLFVLQYRLGLTKGGILKV